MLCLASLQCFKTLIGFTFTSGSQGKSQTLITTQLSTLMPVQSGDCSFLPDTQNTRTENGYSEKTTGKLHTRQHLPL